MNQGKKYILVITFLIINFYIFGVQAEDVKHNKNISVVFDDSGSMALDVRWAHANYALQTLVSVLNEGDLLQIHYMNASEKDVQLVVSDEVSIGVVLSKIRSESIPDLIGDGITPIKSISEGLQKLEPGNPLQKENTIYDNWLVLITDGNEMTDENNVGYVNYVEDNSFDSGYKWVGMLDRKLANVLSSSKLEFNTVILKIGDTSQDMLLTSSMIGSPLIYKSASVSEEFILEKQIIENMNDLASLISGRFPIDIISKNNNEITLNSQVPFNDFDILLQNSNSKVVSVLGEDKNPIDVEITYTDLLSPDNQLIGGRSLVSDTNLYGSDIRITPKGEEALPEGNYTIVFDADVQDAKVASYCYPFIEFNFKYYVNGIEVNKVYQEDRISIEFIPVRGGTDEVLGNLPDNIVYTLDLKSGDQFLTFQEDTLKTNEFIIKSDTIEGSLTAEIPDIWLWSLIVTESISVAPKEEKPEERQFELLISSDVTRVKYSEFDNAPYVEITPYLNGQLLTAEEMEKADLSIIRITTEDGKLAQPKYELIKEGTSFKFKPIYTGFRPTLPTMNDKIELRFSSHAFEDVNEYAFGEFVYIIEDASFLVRYFTYILTGLVLLVLILYLIGLIARPKFKNNKYLIRVEKFDSILDMDDPVTREYHEFKINGFQRLFVPYKPEKATAAELEFKAGKKADHIYLVKSSQILGMVIGSYELKGEYVGKRDLRLNLDQKIELVVDGKLIKYRYVKKEDKDR